MTLDPTKVAELERLVSELIDSESVDSAKLDELVKILEESPEAHDEYLERIGLHASLRECKDQFELAGAIQAMADDSQAKSAPQPWWKRPAAAWALALSLLIAVGFFLILFTTNKTPDETPVAQNDPGQPLQIERPATGMEKLFLARITQLKQARWRNAEQLAIGRVLEPRRLELESGEAEITFDSGAAVTLVGPAALSLDSTFAATLHYGKAWADVPTPAIGFTIDTPTAEVEDLGTRFAVDVSNAGDSDIVVLEGEVRVNSRQGYDPKEQIVAVNQAVRVRMDQPEIMPIDVPMGLSQQTPLGSFQSQTSVPFYLWRFDATDDVAAGKWEEEGWNPDKKAYPAVSEQEANATGAVMRSVEGVYGRAIWMNGRGGYLETQLPGIAQDHPRTICFWVRVPKDAQPEHAYSMISWGDWSKSGGKFQVGWNSRKLIKSGVQGAIRTEISGGFVIGQNDLRDGRWHHIGIVYLGGTNEETRGDIRNRIRMYVDGQLEPFSAYRDGKVNTQISEKSEQVSFGRFLAEPAAQKAFSTFYGTLDEMYLFDGALTPSQINQLRQNNAPPAPTEIVPVRH